MPEYPDVVVYIDRLRAYVQGKRLEQLRISHIFLLRTAVPPISEIDGRRVLGFERIGKRIVFAFEDDLFLVLHLMVSGRLRWRKRGVQHHGQTMSGCVGLRERVAAAHGGIAARSGPRCTWSAVARRWRTSTAAGWR